MVNVGFYIENIGIIKSGKRRRGIDDTVKGGGRQGVCEEEAVSASELLNE
jgi:hypothetical protein